MEDILLQKASQEIHEELTAHPCKGLPLLHRSSTDLTLYEIDESETWGSLKRKFPKTATAKKGFFQILTDETPIAPSQEITDDPVDLDSLRFSQSSLYVLSKVKFEPLIPAGTDILVIHCRGDAISRDAFLDFWMMPDLLKWFDSVGRQCNYQQLDDSTWRLLFRPKLPNPAMPVSLFTDLLQKQMIRSMFMSLQQENGTEVHFKYEGSPLCTAELPADLPIELLIFCMQHFRQLHPMKGTPVLIASGRRCTEPALLSDIKARRPDATKFTIHVGMPLIGGGPSSQHFSNKQELLKMVQAGVANKFLQFGLDLPQVTESTAKLMEAVSIQRLNHMLNGESQEESDESFKALCQSLNVQLPKQKMQLHLTAAKHKKLKMKKLKAQQYTIDPDKYHLVEGFFLNEDKTAATVLKSFSFHSTGVALVSAETADALMATACDSPPDELAVYVLGPINPPARFEVLETNAPAIDPMGRQVLLNGRLVQFGHKRIKTIGLQSVVDPKEVQVAAVTLWRDDYDSSMWDRIKASPVKATKDLLALEGLGDLLGKPWGRAYRAKGLPVAPDHAESIQFHCEFQKNARFSQLLRRSGFNRIYVTRKNSQGGTEDGWRIIWLNHSTCQIESMSMNLTGASGLVRTAKSYGLRVEHGSFESAWSKLRPDADIPDTRQMRFTYKVHPLPAGTDKEILGQWAAQYKWDIKALRPLGARSWLIASDQAPPNLLMFNSQPLLVQLVPTKGTAQAGDIAAGPRGPTNENHKARDASSRQLAIFRSGDPHLDPWEGSARTLQTEASSQDPNKTRQTHSSVRQPAGPISDMFQQQDSRIVALETTLNKMQIAQSKQQDQTEAKLAQVSEQLSQHITGTKQGFDQMQKEQQCLTQHISQALQRQDDRLATSLDELKNLFLQSRGIKRNNDGEMEDLGDADNE